MGLITNVYSKMIYLHDPAAANQRVVLAPGETHEWPGPNCYVSCDYIDYTGQTQPPPGSFSLLSEAIREDCYVAGEWLWHGVKYIVHCGITDKR